MGVKLIVSENGGLHDRSALVRSNPVAAQFTFTNTRGQRGTATVPLMIPTGNGYAPKIGWPVWIYETTSNSPSISSCVFVGTIDQLEILFNTGDFGYHELVMTLTSLEQMFDTIQCPIAEYTSTNAGAIFTALFNAISGQLPVPVTLGEVDAGVSINDRKYDGTQSVWAAMSQLATDSAFIAYIDPSDQKLYFTAKTARLAAFTLTSDMILWETIQWTQSRADFVDTQVLQLNPNALPTDNSVFAGNGTQNIFTLPYPITAVTRAFLTISTQASATGTFTGQPSPGDTITITPPYSPVITPPSYTFVAALDNTVYGQVLIGASLTATIQNLVDAINGNPATRSTAYSFPTWNNQQVVARAPSSTNFILWSQQLGAYGNTIGISKSCANFSWSSSFLLGGVDSKSQELSVGPLQGGVFDVGYVNGSANIQLQQQPAVGVNLSVDYFGPMTGLITVSNNLAASLGVASQYAIMRSRNVSTGADAIQQAAAALAAYSTLPAQFQFSTYTPGIYMGHWITVGLVLPLEAGGLVNGNWLVQSVQGTWTPGMETLGEPWGHFLYTIVLINSTQISTYQDTLAQLASTSTTNPQPNIPPTGGNQQSQPSIITQGVLQICQRTLLIKDSTVGNDIADHVTIFTRETQLSPVVYATASVQRIQGVLRKTISADLTVRFNAVGQGSPQTSSSWTMTIQASTPINKTLMVAISGNVNDGDVLYADVVASDGSKDADGIASFSFYWE